MKPAAPRPQKLGLRELKKQRTRETILKAAFELFAKRGYANTTLDDIAEAAEVAIPAQLPSLGLGQLEEHTVE